MRRISLIIAIVILLIITGYLTYLATRWQNKSKGKTSQGYSYATYQINETVPNFISIAADGDTTRFYDVVNKNLRTFSIEEKKIIWQSGSIEQKLERVVWSPNTSEAFIAYQDEANQGETLTTRFRLVNGEGKIGEPLGNDITDIGWWNSNQVFALRFNPAKNTTDVVIINKLTGQTERVLFQLKGYVTRAFPSSNNRFMVSWNPVEGGDDYAGLWSINENGSGASEIKKLNFLPNVAAWSPNNQSFAAFTQGEGVKGTVRVYEAASGNDKKVDIQTTLAEKVAWLDNNTLLAAKPVVIGQGFEEGDKLVKINVNQPDPDKEEALFEPKEKFDVLSVRVIQGKNVVFVSENRLYVLHLEK